MKLNQVSKRDGKLKSYGCIHINWNYSQKYSSMSSSKFNRSTVHRHLQIPLHRTDICFLPSYISVLTSKVVEKMGRRKQETSVSGEGQEQNVVNLCPISSGSQGFNMQRVFCAIQQHRTLYFQVLLTCVNTKGATPWYSRWWIKGTS